MSWLRRTVSLHDELAAIAEPDPRWWLIAAGSALAERFARPGEVYLACDAEPDADTFMGYAAPWTSDPIDDAVARARAARAAIRALDGTLRDQPLAVTLSREAGGTTRPCTLDLAAFAIGERVLLGRLDDPSLPMRLRAGRGEPFATDLPFVCVSIGDEPIATARHGHRRAWTDRGGPWLGLGRSGDLAIVSTCHLVVDGYGHARLTAQIAASARPPGAAMGSVPVARLPPVPGAVPLAIAWRALARPTPRVIPLAYRAGCLLHRMAARDARFSPTIQIPVARGAKDDPDRLHHRVVSMTTSVRFDRGEPEPFEVFEERVRASIAREAAARGLVSRLLAAARAVPVPLAWKRRGIGAKRPAWLESFAAVIGGRALLSRIAIDVASPPLCAVSSPSRLATAEDPVGGCVITVVDDGERAAITLCGSGFAGTVARADGLLDELLA